MSHKIPASQFFDRFFSQCEDQFSFLEDKHDYSCIAGLLEYRKMHELVLPYKKHDLENALAQVMYERGDISILFRYNFQKNKMESYCRYQIHQLSLLFISRYFAPDADVDNIPHSIVPDVMVSELPDIDKGIQIFKEALYPNMFLMEPCVKNIRAKLFYSALNAKNTVREKAVKAQYVASVKFACEQAAVAFLEGDYKRVIQFLQPYERELTPSCKKKLDLAKRLILQP